MTELAIFDLDYTLTRRGTWGRFINKSLEERPDRIAGLWASAGIAHLQYKLGALPRIAVKTEMMRRSIAGRKRCELGQLADDFVAEDIQSGLNPKVLEAFNRHKAEGHTILIASAAVCILVERYADALGADGYVCTNLDWTDDNRLASTFGSENCYGPTKLDRIRNWIDSSGLQPTKITAYSDCCSDAPMLEMADHAFVVARKSKAKAYAEGKGFEVW